MGTKNSKAPTVGSTVRFTTTVKSFCTGRIIGTEGDTGKVISNDTYDEDSLIEVNDRRDYINWTDFEEVKEETQKETV